MVEPLIAGDASLATGDLFQGVIGRSLPSLAIGRGTRSSVFLPLSPPHLGLRSSSLIGEPPDILGACSDCPTDPRENQATLGC
jgi:hypothetical protein